MALGVMLLLSLSFVPSVLANQPSTVTVRVVGLTGTTLLPQTSVTTTAAPIEPETGHACSGTSAGGALYDAIHGNWVVKYESFGYAIDGIQGLNFPAFSPSSPPDAYWSFWLNDMPATEGACGQELESGDDIVFFAQCIELGTDCPASATAPQHFLTETAPAASSVQVGTPLAVTVGSQSTESGAKESLPSGVTVSAGSISATPNAQGVATLTFPSPGTYTLEASAPDSVPSDPHTVCVHNGPDGTCGTQVLTACATESSPAGGCGGPGIVPPPPATVTTVAAGVKPGHVYPKRKAPRILKGSVNVPAGGTLKEVRIGLLRRTGKRCFAFNGSKERFVKSRCGAAKFFSVGDTESFSYLLPAALPRGRYVYDVEAVDASGHVTKLVPGVSHVLFYVK
ncbi:MAG: hypothetical protein WB998_08545 [Solirubrobacteraceae bacterium]